MFFDNEEAHIVEILSCVVERSLYPYSQYHDCWWTVDARNSPEISRSYHKKDAFNNDVNQLYLEMWLTFLSMILHTC